MTSILALDLGTNCGWALRTRDGLLRYGTQSFKVDKYSGAGMRYLKFRHWLEERAFNAERVAYEAVRRHVGTDAAHVYGGLMATLTAFCEDKGIPYEGIPVGTIKKYGCGKGNGSKEEMIAAAVALGHSPQDDNAADALHLLLYIESVNQTLKNAIK